MSLKIDINKVTEALSTVYCGDGQVRRAFTGIVEALEALEDCDEKAADYRDLCEKVLEELECAEAETIYYNSPKFRARFEEMKNG